MGHRQRSRQIRGDILSESGWIGVDLDGTLAYYDGWRGPEHIGPPIPKMVERVKEWQKRGITVKIFTARASDESQIPFIKKWLVDNDLGDLEVTNVKDFGMISLYDDRAFRVEKNTGRVIY